MLCYFKTIAISMDVNVLLGWSIKGVNGKPWPKGLDPPDGDQGVLGMARGISYSFLQPSQTDDVALLDFVAGFLRVICLFSLLTKSAKGRSPTHTELRTVPHI